MKYRTKGIELFTDYMYTRVSMKSINELLDKVIIRDCIKELKEIPDRCIDLIILDPPYWKVIGEEWDYKWRTIDDYVEWCNQWLPELSRIIKLSGSMYLFGYLRNLIYTYKEIEQLGFIFRQQLIIDKGIKAVSGRATKGYKMFPNVTESIFYFIFDSKPFIKKILLERQKKTGLTAYEINSRLGVKANGGGMWSIYTGDNILAQVPTKEMWDKLQKVLEFEYPYEDIAQVFNIQMGITDVWTDINYYKEERYHPTQKPIQLIDRIIRASTNEGMVVLDPFIGSGSTAVSCIKLRRHFIGIETDSEYTSKAEKRIEEMRAKPALGI